MNVKTLHPDYPARAARLEFALDHYTGDVYEVTPSATDPDGTARTAAVVGMKAEPYLVQHSQGESDEAFRERRRVTTYVPHLSFAVDSLAGQVVAREPETERAYETDAGPSPLGDPEAEGSAMARLWEDADGAGTDWPTLWAALAPRLVVAREWFQYVEPPAGDLGARVVHVSPVDVIDWQYGAGRLEWAVVRERSHAPRTPGTEAQAVTSYLVLYLDGWERYESRDEGEPAMVGSGLWRFVDREGRDRLPARFVGVPIARDLGWQMAREANGILQLASTRDFRLWTACTNRLHIDGGDSTADDMEGYADALREHGQSLITTRGGGTVAYIHPSQEPAQVSHEILGDRVRAFYHTFFRSYEDAAREKTATEIRGEQQAGTGAYLALLAHALDEAEADALFLLEQALYPDRPAEWGRCAVTRSRRFDPAPPEAQAEALAEVVARGLPLGPKGLASAVAKIAELLNLTADPDEIEAAVAADSARSAVRPDRLAALRAGGRFDPSLAA